MSAFGTKKPLSDVELQLSFPAVFQQAYADTRQPLAYEGSRIATAAPLPTDKNFQGAYHEQKRREAHATVRNAVRDTRMAINRALVSHAGYWSMPKAELSQRVYANPSMGSGQADIYSARRTAPGSMAPFQCNEVVMGSGLSGGVLRSKQGQEYGKKILMNRIAQLNAIDAAAQGLDTGAPISTVSDPDFAVSQGLPTDATGQLVKLIALLNGLIAAFSGGERLLNRFAVSDLTDMMLLLFRVAPTANREELENILEAFDYVLEIINDEFADVFELPGDWAVNINPRVGVGEKLAIAPEEFSQSRSTLDLLSQPSRSTRSSGTSSSSSELSSLTSYSEGSSTIKEADANKQYALVMIDLVPRLRKYVIEMLAAVDRSPKERQALSKSLIVSLGLNKWRIYLKLLNPELRQKDESEVASGFSGSTGNDDGPDGPDDMSGDFDAPARPREDEEADSLFSSEYSRSTDERARNRRANVALAERERPRERRPARFFDEEALLIGEAPGDPRRRLDEAGPQRFARQGSLGFFGETAATAQPALINPARMGSMTAPEAATAAAYREAPLPMLPGANPRREAAIAAAEVPAGEQLPAAAMAARELTRAPSTASSQDVVIPRRRGVQIATPVGRGKKAAPKKAPAKKAPAKKADTFITDVVAHLKKGSAPAAPAKKGKGRPAVHPKLMNASGKRHKGAYHQMPDGTYMTGATHSARSKPLTVA